MKKKGMMSICKAQQPLQREVFPMNNKATERIENLELTQESIEDFRKYLAAAGMSARTQTAYPKRLYEILRWSNINYINEKIMNDYKTHMLISKSPATVNLMVSAVNTYIAYKGWNGSELSRVRDVDKRKRKVLTIKEYEQLLRKAKYMKNKNLYYILQTIYILRIRASELKLITVENIENGIFSSDNGNVTYRVPPELQKELLSFAKEIGIRSGTIFRNRNGNVIDRNRMSIMIAKLGVEAGLERGMVTAEQIRHIKDNTRDCKR